MKQSDVHELAKAIEELATTMGFKSAEVIYGDNNTRSAYGLTDFYSTFQVQLHAVTKDKNKAQPKPTKPAEEKEKDINPKAGDNAEDGGKDPKTHGNAEGGTKKNK